MAFLLINKSAGWTSLDVVAKMRGILHVERIGHAGTLDPFATGLLIVGVGRESTKRLDEFKLWEKEYEVILQFGATSSTYDCDGEIVSSSNPRPITREELETVVQKYRGQIQQIPPMHSAKKVNGKRLYKFAHQGIVVEREPQNITIYNLEILECTPDSARLKIVCSPGTYIRSLAHDIGQDLGVGAYAAALTRTRIGLYHLMDAITLDDLVVKRQDWESLTIKSSWHNLGTFGEKGI